MKRIALQVPYNEKFYNSLPLISQTGFKYVALGFGSSKCFHAENWKNEIKKIIDALQKNNLKCIQTHAPYFDLRISAEQKDLLMETAIKRSIEATRLLGANLCAVHPRSVFRNANDLIVDEKKSFCENYKDFKKMIPICEEYNVLLGIENLPHFPGWTPEFFSCHPIDQINLIDSLKSSFVGAVWDTGHSHLMEYDQTSGYKQADAIAMLGNRIKGTHLHNNYGYYDEHFILNKGTIDWAEILKALSKVGYQGDFTLETEPIKDEKYEKWIKECFLSTKIL